MTGSREHFLGALGWGSASFSTMFIAHFLWTKHMALVKIHMRPWGSAAWLQAAAILQWFDAVPAQPCGTTQNGMLSPIKWFQGMHCIRG